MPAPSKYLRISYGLISEKLKQPIIPALTIYLHRERPEIIPATDTPTHNETLHMSDDGHRAPRLIKKYAYLFLTSARPDDTALTISMMNPETLGIINDVWRSDCL
uniref:Uncharacterized protein n=1 Tax=Pseudomonas extremaustralis TaxID=359110 RepID=A0AEG1_9PSED|nr:hypothetical protein [Pseudomonas extremaustralis 14-3]